MNIIVLKPENYIPKYQLIINSMMKDNKTKKENNNNSGIGISSVKSLAVTNPNKKVKSTRGRKPSSNKKHTNIVTLNFKSGDRIFYRKYNGDNENLNPFLIGDIEENPIKEDIERTVTEFIYEREYDLDLYNPKIHKDIKSKFAKTFINKECFIIMKAYVEQFKKNKLALIFEVIPNSMFCNSSDKEEETSKKTKK